MSTPNASRKRTTGAVSPLHRHRPGVSFNDAEMETVREAARREHLPVTSYIRRVVLKDAESGR